MATIIDSLLVTLGLDSSGVDKGISQTNAKINGGLKSIATALAPLAGAVGLTKLISDYTKAADELGKFSRKVRENISDVQGWQNAIDAAGHDSKGFQNTLTGLDQQLRVIGRRGMSNSYAFRALGVSARDANGNVKTSTEILTELSQVADKMNPERFRRLTEKLGIDADTIRFLQSGSKEVGTLVDKYKDLAYTQKDAEISRQFNVTMGDLNKTFQAFAATGLRVLVPALTFVADKFALIVNFLRKHEPFVKAFIVGLAAVILYTLLPAIAAIAAGIWAAIAPLLPFIALVAVLALLFDDLWTYINGGTSALDDFWSIFGTGEEISETLAELWEDLKAIGIALWDGVKAAAQAFFSYFGPALSALGNVFKNALKLIKAIFTGDFEAIIEAVKELFKSIGDYLVAVFTGAFNLIYDLFSQIFTGIADFFGGILDSILSSVTSFIKSIISKIPDFLLPDSIIEWAKEADKTVAEVGANMAQVAAPNAPGTTGNAAQGVAPSSVAGAGSVDNSSETTVNVQKIEVNATSNDPNAIAGATGSEIRKLANTGNRGVRQ